MSSNDSPPIAQSDETASEKTTVTVFTPPSITAAALGSGASYTFNSALPPVLQTDLAMPCILGVDEAGRGPVLGPMVYAVAFVPADSVDVLEDFDDSKKLSSNTRSSLLRLLCTPGTDLHKNMGWSCTLLSARDISAGMLSGSTGGNLNAQAHEATIELIRSVIDRGVNIVEIFVDTVGPPQTYQAKLAKLFPGAKVTVSKKADSLYPIVSAASVCAKVTRDSAVDVLSGGEVVGSGYPGDEKTKNWLRDAVDPVFGWDPSMTRFSWKTAKDLLEEETSQVEWPDAEADGEQTITSAFAEARETESLGNWFGRPAAEI
ncbi:ribonuclease HII-domain-containing protein [Sphaerosporella brunnea]|uniref:Ribonuclease n=1 Tax=Sphaerosporella brunnea TaxID=1250544 RepID=A0A5J5EGZ0_9PEZI|nr:ribonuclease HII-domain-containing protein [Sphaerosporella brunnea]